MTRLLFVELLRYRSRRAVKGAGLLIVAAIAVASTIVFFNSSKDAAAVAAGRDQHEIFVRECIRSYEGFPEHQLPPEYDSAEDLCAAETPLSMTDPRFHLEGLTDVLTGMSPLIVILGLGLGATFIGAEWGAGTVTTLLTWEPRRVRVLVAKALAGSAFVFIAAVCVQALLGLALTPAAAVRGTLEGVDASWFADTAGVALRSGLVAAFAAAIGFSLASVARNTGASIIVAFVYFAILENVMRAYRPNWTRWLFGDNAALFVTGALEPTDFSLTHSATRAVLTIALYAALCVAAATLVFRRRDVT